MEKENTITNVTKQFVILIFDRTNKTIKKTLYNINQLNINKYKFYNIFLRYLNTN